MNDMYKIIEELCGKRHVNITQMCRETGVPRGSITDLKMGRSESLSTKTLSKLAEYFQVPMDRFINAEAEPEPADMSELYSRIDKLCKARNTNVTALCKAAGVARSSLSELNAGRTKTLTLETARKLADALNVPVDELMGIETKEEPAVPGGLSEEEREWLGWYRNASDIEREMARRILRGAGK